MTSPILEVLIGLFFIFSLLSILVTQINAIVSQALKLRSKYLFQTITEMIHDPELVARFVTHPLIRIIDFNDVPGMEKWEHLLPNQKLTEEQALQISKGALRGVEWIEDKTFSTVLLSLITVKEDRQLFKVLEDIAVQMDDPQNRRLIRQKINVVIDTGTGIDDLINAINGLPASAHKKALIERLRDISRDIGDKGMKTDINVGLLAGVEYIKDQYLKNALNTILVTSKSIDEAEVKITNWYNNANSKATELFKRDMKRYSYLIGLIVAILLNIDTLYISLQLWNDPILRQALAQTASETNLEELEQLNSAAETRIDSASAQSFEEVAASLNEAGATLARIQDSRIPMGWNFASLASIRELNPNDTRLDDSRYIWNLIPGNNPNFAWLISLKVIGILATMLAIGQGAPFWFNILRQVR